MQDRSDQKKTKKTKEEKKRLWLFTGTKREQDAKNTTKHVNLKSDAPPSHDNKIFFPFSSEKQAHKRKHIKSLKFYTLVLHVFDIKFLSSSSSLTEPHLIFFSSLYNSVGGKPPYMFTPTPRVTSTTPSARQVHVIPRMPKNVSKISAANFTLLSAPPFIRQ